MEQRSAEWYAARLGKVTASRASDILAQGRRKTADCKCGNTRAKPPKCSRCGDPVYLEPGESYKGYRRELCMERFYGIQPPELRTAELDHGIEYEPFAIADYEFAFNVTVERVGFVTHPKCSGIGCSPDGLVRDDGMIEVKCPFPRNHMKHLEGDLSDYLSQIDFQLGVTGREWCDFVSWSHRDEFAADKLYVKRVLAAHRQEEIAHVMAVARRLNGEIDAWIGEKRAEVPGPKTTEGVADAAPGRPAAAVGDHERSADGSNHPGDIPF